jgi:hypothetical protein
MGTRKSESVPDLTRLKWRNQLKPMDHKRLAKRLPKPLQLVQTPADEQIVYELWVSTYKDIYPHFEVPLNDPQNRQAYILYTRDSTGKAVSSIRLTFDSPLGMPSEGFYPPEIDTLRELNYKLMEFGRMINLPGDLDLLKLYHRVVYQIAGAANIDLIIMTLKQKDVAFYRNLMGAHLLLADMQIPHGGKHKVACVAWDIKQTKARFFKWVGLNHSIEGLSA